MNKALIQHTLDEITSAQTVPCIALGFLTQTQSEVWISGNQALVPEVEALKRDAQFDLASLTKVVVTTTLILKLVEKGKLSLETPISSILTDFRYPDITVFHLLTHTSGLCADHKGYKDHVGVEALRRFIMDLPLSETPGKRVVYTDFGFILLGWVVEALMGPLDQAAKNEIFEPLGMKDTGYRPADPLRCVPTELSAHRGLIRGVVHDGKANNLGGVSGNAGIFSTIDDLMRFVQSLLFDERLLRKLTKTLLRQTHTQGLDFKRTLGWYRKDPTCALGPLVSQDILYHTGFSGTSILIDYEAQSAIVILTNRVHPKRDNDSIQDLRLRLHNLIYTAHL